MRQSQRRLLYLLAGVVAVGLVPLVIQNDYVLQLLETFAYLYVMVLGLDVLLGYAGQTSLGQAGFYAIGAYVAVLLEVKMGWTFWPALLLALVASAVAGVLLALPALKAKGPYLALITLSFGFVVHSLVNQWVSVTGGTMGILDIPAPSIAGFAFKAESFWYMAGGSALLAHWAARNVTRSPWGLTLRAVRTSEYAASSLGINTHLTKVAAFVFSAVYAGFAGVLFAHQYRFINSDSFTLDTSLVALFAVLVGGGGSQWGPALGTVLISLLPQFFVKLVDYNLLLYGFLLMVTQVLVPGGIGPYLEALFRRRAVHQKQTFAPAIDPRLPRHETSRGTPLLTAENLSVSFGGVRAVQNVGLTLRAGMVHGLIGPNGSGKTTLVNTLTGYLTPNEGIVKFQGEIVTGLPAHRRAKKGIARTFQALEIFDDLTVLENVVVGYHTRRRAGFWAQFFSGRSASAEEAELRNHARGLLAFLGLTEWENEPAGRLPYGLRRLVEIARALAREPEVLILDEPAAGLNPAEVEALTDRIRTLRDGGTAVLLIEHHTDMVFALCDTVSVLHLGQKVAEGAPAAVQADPRVIEAYLGKQEATASA